MSSCRNNELYRKRRWFLKDETFYGVNFGRKCGEIMCDELAEDIAANLTVALEQFQNIYEGIAQ